MTVIDLSNRNTTSKRIPEIDSLYAYDTRHKAKFTHRNQKGAGYRYTNHRVIIPAGDSEIHIYHRTADIRGVSKGLTMVTKNGKSRDVQKWFKEQVKAVEANDSLFDIFSHATVPVELGLRYTWN